MFTGIAGAPPASMVAGIYRVSVFQYKARCKLFGVSLPRPRSQGARSLRSPWLQ